MLKRHSLATAILLPLLSLVVEAQSVLVVDGSSGPGSDFDNVTDAIAAAVPGEIVLVRPGTYNEPTLFLNKPLSLIADGGTVTLGGELVVSGVGVGEQTLVHGLILDVQTGTQAAALTITGCLGRVTVQDCTVLGTELAGANPGDAMSVESSAAVALTRLTLRTRAVGTQSDPARPALSILDSTVALHACDLEGSVGAAGSGDAGVPGRSGGAALRASGVSPSNVLVASSTLAGGSGGAGGVGPISPLACSNGGSGGEAIQVDAALGVVTTLDSTILGGAGGSSPSTSCADGMGGVPSVVIAGSLDLAGPSGRTIFVTPIAREGEQLTLTLKGLPGEFVVLAYSLDSGPAAYDPMLVGALHIGQSFFNRLAGFVPLSGMAAWSVTLLDLGIEGFVMYSQAFHIDINLMTVSASSPSATALLDVSF